jgi:hypothetical protein
MGNPESVFGMDDIHETLFLNKFRDAYRVYEEDLWHKGWHKIGRGRQRTTFAYPNSKTVIKVSHVPMGVMANLFEHYYSQMDDKVTIRPERSLVEIPIPKTYGLTRVGPLSVLCVERVTPSVEGFHLSKNGNPWIFWVDVSEGKPQVGFTVTSNRLVCYDWCPF